MSILSKMQGKSMKYKLGDEEIELKPLKTRKGLELFLKTGGTDPNAQTDAFVGIIRETLIVSIPDATPEEIEGLALPYIVDLIPAIMEVNGIKVPKKKLEALQGSLSVQKKPLPEQSTI